jgi:hypothetical protein
MGDGAGACRATDEDCRPIERPPPSGLAVASATIDSAVTAMSILAQNFFMVALLNSNYV